MANNIYTDKELTRIFGKRALKGTPLFEPQELGWVCPEGHFSLAWSEFRRHIWCYVCKKDYFSFLCKKEMNPHTTERILHVEREKLRKELDEWTIEKYRALKPQERQAD